MTFKVTFKVCPPILSSGVNESTSGVFGAQDKLLESLI